MLRKFHTIVATAALAMLALYGSAGAYVHEGQPAPPFTKNTLAGPPYAVGPAVSLADYAGKIVVIFLLGCT
jgi:hypothetical protein